MILLGLNVAIGFTGNIDWRAHLGGLVTGCVLAFLYDYAGGLRDRTAGLALAVGGTAAVVGLLALLITGVVPGQSGSAEPAADGGQGRSTQSTGAP